MREGFHRIPACGLILFYSFLVWMGSFGGSVALSATPNEMPSMHWSADRTLWDRKNQKVSLSGRASVHQSGETILADRIEVDLKARVCDAYGNVVYSAGVTLIHADELHVNLDTRTGTIHGGRVSGEHYSLTGDLIQKLGPSHFKTERGHYSTCKDCPQSWSLLAGQIDMEVEGYGYLSNVIGKVNDAPMFWLPYLVIPLKSKRQSGLLFPRFGLSNLGFNFVQPIFFALSRSTDMTLGLGHYGGRGRRVEWEGRYALERGSALAQVFYQRDKTFGEYLEGQRLNLGNSTERWGLNLQQNHEFPFGIRQKLRLLEVSDNLYPSNLNDVPGFGEAFIASDLSLSHATNQVSTYGYVRRHRNLIHSAPDPRSFDDDTVQVFPHAVLTTNDRFLFGSSVAGGLTLGLTNFTRGGGPFDRDQTGGPVDDGTPFRLGQDPLRESLRLSLKPTLYTTLRPFDVVQWVPSLRYHQYFYSFPGGVESLSRGYLQFTNDLSTQLERIYEFEDPGTPKMKHLIRPMLRYSLIPAISEPRHPFMQQMQFARDNDYTGYNFDNEDLVPIDPPRNNSNYFMPQGNAIEYGFSTQLIRKRNSQILRERMLQEDRENPGRQNLMIPQALPGAGFQGASYQRSLEWQGGQSFNFRELRQTGRPQQPLSRLYSRMLAEYDQWSGGIDYFYIPYQPITASTNRHIFTTSGTYFFERSLRQGVLDFERSMNFTYGFNRSSTTSQTHNLRTQVTWSLSDYVMPSVAFAYDLLSRLPQTLTTRLSFQSPSECWRLMLTMNQTQCQLITPNLSGWCSNFNIDLAMNWAGRGFGGLGAP